MARFRVSMKVKDLACNFDSDASYQFQAIAQAVLILKRLYHWFDWYLIDDIIVMDGDFSTPSGFAVCFLGSSDEDGNE